MEVCKPEKEAIRVRPPFFPAHKNGSVHRSGTRETSSRFRLPNRAVSTERKRPSKPPPSLPSPIPSTPLKDTTAETLLESRGSKLKESLWPSAMRSLTVAFQSDILYVPASKREKQVSHTPDRTLRPSSNVAVRKSELKQSRVRGKKSSDQTENSKPVDGLHSRHVNQNQWPSKSKSSFLCHLGSNAPSLRRLSKPLKKSSSDLSGKTMLDERSVQIKKAGFACSLDKIKLANAAAIALSMQAHVSSSSPSSPSVSRGISPRRVKAVGPSPTRVRLSSASRQPQTSNSVLRFFADIKKGNKATNHIEDVHDLRLLYNRHLQWRYANARSDDVLHSQQVKAEKTLYNIWFTIVDMRHTVIEERIGLHQLNLKLMLYSVVNSQLVWLNKWGAIERDHTNSLNWAIQDLQASTIRVPITEGAKGNIETIKSAVCAAVGVLEAMGSSLSPIVSQVEGTNSLVSQLAILAARERTMLDECESLLSSTTATLQVEEQSIRTHLLQMSQTNGERDHLYAGTKILQELCLLPLLC